MATTTRKTKWGETLADYGERFNEINGILSDGDGSTMSVSRRRGGLVLAKDGTILAERLTEQDMGGLLHAMWLLAETATSHRHILARYIEA